MRPQAQPATAATASGLRLNDHAAYLRPGWVRSRRLKPKEEPAPAAMPAYRAKVFGDGPSRPLDRKAKLRIMAYADDWNVRNKLPGQHKGPITRTFRDVLRALLWGFHNEHTGRCFPSLQTIAAKAGCARSTVQLAIKVLEAAGILTWVNRLATIREQCVDATGALIWHPRDIRTSNGYLFHDPVENRGKPPKMPDTEFRAGSSFQDSLDSFLSAGAPAGPVDNCSGGERSPAGEVNCS